MVEHLARQRSVQAKGRLAKITTNSAGSSRRARRSWKSAIGNRPVAAFSRAISEMIRKPEITKNTSTPR